MAFISGDQGTIITGCTDFSMGYLKKKYIKRTFQFLWSNTTCEGDERVLLLTQEERLSVAQAD
jgi:hypothetical protein